MRKVSSVFACLLVTGTLLSACGGNNNGNKPAADGEKRHLHQQQPRRPKSQSLRLQHRLTISPRER